MFKIHLDVDEADPTLFGIPFEDLTEQQIKKINIDQLTLFLKFEIAQKIFIDKINTIEMDDEFYYKYDRIRNAALKYSNIRYVLNLRAETDDRLLKRIFDGEYYEDKILSPENRKKYLTGLIETNTMPYYKMFHSGSNYCIVDLIDDSFLLKIERMLSHVTNDFKQTDLHNEARQTIGSYISYLSKTQFDSFLNKIKDTSLYQEALISKHINDEDTHKILKSIKNSKYYIRIGKPVSINVLKKFAAISRLEVIERLLDTTKNIYEPGNYLDNISKEQLSELLFSASLRYTKRVQRVLNSHDYNVNHLKDKNNG